MKIISYYTKNTPYEEVANTHLIPSLKKWNLSYEVEAINDLGDWQKNTGYKSQFVLKMLNKHKNNVCFLDCDATIEQYPTKLFNIKEAILKQKSPSCGCGKIHDGTFSDKIIKGNGVTAALLKKNGIKIITEEDL